MAITRDNHFVPRWYQRGFCEPGRSTLAYLDLNPSSSVRADGREFRNRTIFDAPTKRCFYKTDLYSTFFGTTVNDEIERKLFGDIDTRGAHAVRAFEALDPAAWHEHFEAFFEYMDIQKLRTPKGLAWLRDQYPALDQNGLMLEMQGIRKLHTTIWTQCVKEVVSAEDAKVKFIVTDHPVTIYNYAIPPEASQCIYPNDPGIALKASQTIFPLSRNYCLILTNLEYAENPSVSPTEKRTFPRNFRQSLARTDNVIRSRQLNDLEVSKINRVLKARAARHVAAGKKEWLQPEDVAGGPWADLAPTLLPPRDKLWSFGGETFVGYRDGSVHYQDAFGRTEKEGTALKKVLPVGKPQPKDLCSCGSGHLYRVCCQPRPTALRPSWTELSIRERNLCLYHGILSILHIDQGKDWITIRRELTVGQIREVYSLYQALWPLETDLLSLLPKPDGRPRAVYTGPLHPQSIVEFAMGSSLYFGEIIMENPFIHATAWVEEFSPIQNPGRYHLEFLKSVAFFLEIMPLVEIGFINLIPDPWIFDYHLRRETRAMARERTSNIVVGQKDEPRFEELARLDQARTIFLWPKDAQEAHLRERFPDIDDDGLNRFWREMERRREGDPLAALQEGLLGGGKEGNQIQHMRLNPNFETTMYLAQATGSSIITDSAFRWQEILRVARFPITSSPPVFRRLAENIAGATFLFPNEADRLVGLVQEDLFATYPRIFAEIFRYLQTVAPQKPRPNFEDGVAARFLRAHTSAQAALQKRRVAGTDGKISCVFMPTGIQDNTINRLLIMSSSEHHLSSVAMAFFIHRLDVKRS